MRIALDVRFKTESGSSAYIRQLVPRLIAGAQGRCFVLVKYPSQRFDFEPALERPILCPSESDAAHVAWTTLRLPFHLKRRGVDLYHAMKMPGPFWNSVPAVDTAHSIIDSYKGVYPHTFKNKLFRNLYAKAMLHRVDRLIAVSDFVKECLVARHHVPAEKIDVVYHGVDPRFRPLSPEETERARRARGWPLDFLLCVGNVFPVKNHVTAVRAFALLAAEFPSLQLLIAGGLGHDYAREVRAEVRARGLADRVRFLGFARETELVELMNAARVMLFPSLTEGCPVTMLEAFGCGLPIVAAKRGGLWDLGRERALFVDDPTDARTFASRTRQALTSPALRAEMRRAGLAFAAARTWDDAALRHLAIYDKVLGRVPAPTPGGAAALLQ